MCKMTKFILNNFNLNEDDLKYVPAIVAEIKQELVAGHYKNVFGEDVISEYQLYDIFDEKLYFIQSDLAENKVLNEVAAFELGETLDF